MSRNLVLIVDDDQDVCDGLMEVFDDSEIQTLCASNGREALELLRQGKRPLLILLDVMMPVMDGWEFRDAQLRDPDLRSIPVVVLTAHDDAAQVAKAMNAASFLRKPVQLQDLMDIVARFTDER